MTRHFAVAPGRSIGLDSEMQLQFILDRMAEEYADAECAHDLFRATNAEVAALSASLTGKIREPSDYARLESLRRPLRIYARAFVFALANFARQLELLADHALVPRALAGKLRALHGELRAELFGDAPPAAADEPPAPSARRSRSRHSLTRSPLLMTAVHGDKVTNTTADGSQIVQSINEAMLEVVIATLQNAIDVFPWTSGGRTSYPTQYGAA